MRFNHLVYSVLALLIILACARQSTPLGGPQDEDPPRLISSNPEDQSLNVSPREIILEFSEYIKVENPNKQIIITPKLNTDEIEYVALKNRLNIKLNQELEDSTTYVFNFQTSVKDITENNPAENLKLVFSTGNEIDSLNFSGKVHYLFPIKDKQIKKVLVGLYQANDTTDVVTAPPYYIAQADTSGNFEITNIKAGRYRAYAWYDDNNSLKAEPKTEPYAFIADTIDMQEDIRDVRLNLFRSDITPLAINRSSSVQGSYDLVLSKDPVDVQITHPDFLSDLYYRIKEKNIRLYHRKLVNDSTEISLSIRDSVGFKIDTTIYAVFEESTRAKEKLEVSANSGKNFVKTIRAELTFNKPILHINYDSLLVKFDTASVIPIRAENVSFLDSTRLNVLSVAITVPDTVITEIFTVYAADSTFTDVEGMMNENKLEANYKKIKSENLADMIEGRILTDEFPILVQLLNKKDELMYEQYLNETNQYRFNDIEAGDYQIRAIIDRNKNRKWDTGDITIGRQPEPIYYFKNPVDSTRFLMIRGGWAMEQMDVKPIRESGIPAKPQTPIPTSEETEIQEPIIREETEEQGQSEEENIEK
ncbi:Ig-like domain-containing domain [Pararhodonellum marinum]|uniref:Ig-like domain-containing domain n=1 Tax=Pararhodonellum marinum TaxID=2755358 RepID=UPI00188E4A8B|nr:Ig-like domain-containing domain [Pararhodonellum marinum]